MKKKFIYIIVIFLLLFLSASTLQRWQTKHSYNQIVDYVLDNKIQGSVGQTLKNAGFSNDEIAGAAVRCMNRIIIVTGREDIDKIKNLPKNISDADLQSLEPVLIKIRPFEKIIKTLGLIQEKIEKTACEKEKKKYIRTYEKIKNSLDVMMEIYQETIFEDDLRLIQSIGEKKAENKKIKKSKNNIL